MVIFLTIGSLDIRLEFQLPGICWNCLIHQDGLGFSYPLLVLQLYSSFRPDLEGILGFQFLMKKSFSHLSGKCWTLKLRPSNGSYSIENVLNEYLRSIIWHLEFHYWTLNDSPTRTTTFWNSSENSRFFPSPESWESVSQLVSPQELCSYSGVSVGDSSSISTNLAFLTLSWNETTRRLLILLRSFLTGVYQSLFLLEVSPSWRYWRILPLTSLEHSLKGQL